MQKLEFTLKQHTPLIHFQHDQAGATLRATEVKPKLDQFLIEELLREQKVDFNFYEPQRHGEPKFINSHDVLSDGVGMDAVVDLAQGPGQVPFKRFGLDFVIFEALKFFDEVELEFGRHPRGKFKCNVFMGIGAAGAACCAANANGTGYFYPFTRGQGEAVGVSVVFKGVEFDPFKVWVVDFFPEAQKIEG